MKAVILNVGDEVLSGKVVNTNSATLAHSLSKLSIEVVKTIVVGDDATLIKEEVMGFKNSPYDILITTGGLGPTHDDLTKEVVCEALGLELVLDQNSKTKLDNYFNNKMAACNLKQAYFPKDAIILDNKIGTANGAIIPHNHKLYIILVGPPIELIPMVNDGVLPYLQSITDDHIYVQEYIVMGGGESLFEEKLAPIYQEFPNVNIAPYASVGKIRYQLTAKDAYQSDFIKACHNFEKLMASYIISRDNEEVEEVLYKLLKEKNMKISFAESITGGMMAARLINVPGASDVISESLITYSDEAKRKYLGVKSGTLSLYTAVSREVALEMVTGLADKTNSDVALAVTGYAGPTGTDVGLVYYGIKINDDVYVFENHFRGSREMIRLRATLFGLYKLVTLLR